MEEKNIIEYLIEKANEFTEELESIKEIKQENEMLKKQLENQEKIIKKMTQFIDCTKLKGFKCIGENNVHILNYCSICIEDYFKKLVQKEGRK